MPLSASVSERYEAQKASQKARYHQRVADGLCGQCGHAREPERAEKKTCKACQVKASQAHWRWNQSRLKGRASVERAWNFDTDDLITQHMPLARQLAWQAKAKMGASTSADVDDMLGDALYGLVRAGRTFDASGSIAFGAWATTQIRGEIYDGLRRWLKRVKDRPVILSLTEVEAEEWE